VIAKAVSSISSKDTPKELTNFNNELIASIFPKHQIRLQYGVTLANPNGSVDEQVEVPAGNELEKFDIKAAKISTDVWAIAYTDLSKIYTSTVTFDAGAGTLTVSESQEYSINSSYENYEISISGDHTVLHIFTNSGNARIQSVVITRADGTTKVTNFPMEISEFQLRGYVRYFDQDTFIRGKIGTSEFVVSQLAVDNSTQEVTMINSAPFNFIDLSGTEKLSPELLDCFHFSDFSEDKINCYVEVSSQIAYLLEFTPTG
jgi:hypothetical protein